MSVPPKRRPGPRIACAPPGTPRSLRQPRTGRALAGNRPARLQAGRPVAVLPIRTPVLVARLRPPAPPQPEAQPLARLPACWQEGHGLAQSLQPPPGPPVIFHGGRILIMKRVLKGIIAGLLPFHKITPLRHHHNGLGIRSVFLVPDPNRGRTDKDLTLSQGAYDERKRGFPDGSTFMRNHSVGHIGRTRYMKIAECRSSMSR